jgi:hypothetical protein
MGDESERNN